jgi:hypothetical protein
MGITIHSESVQPLQSVKLVYQPCSRSRAALDPYGIDDHYWTVICLCFCYLFFILPDHMFILGLKTSWCYSYAKTLPTKTYMQLNPCHAFWASWTPCYACWVRHGLTLAISPHLRKGTRLLDSGIVRLVINQSVWSWSEGYTRCSELSFRCVVL